MMQSRHSPGANRFRAQIQAVVHKPTMMRGAINHGDDFSRRRGGIISLPVPQHSVSVGHSRRPRLDQISAICDPRETRRSAMVGAEAEFPQRKSDVS